jgi:hypothetical protein
MSKTKLRSLPPLRRSATLSTSPCHPTQPSVRRSEIRPGLGLTAISGHEDGPSHRGFGYIEFQLPEDALDAIDNMHQNELNGQQLKCHLARPKAGASTIQTNQPVWSNAEFLESVEAKATEKTVA